MGQRKTENGAERNVGCNSEVGKREGEVGQGGVWCQRPEGQWEEGHHAGGGRSAGLR